MKNYTTYLNTHAFFRQLALVNSTRAFFWIVSFSPTLRGCILPEDWVKRARITDIIDIVQLLDSPAERPKLYDGVIEVIDDDDESLG